MYIEHKLGEIEKIVLKGVDSKGLAQILGLLGSSIPEGFIEEMKLYSDFLPKQKEMPYTEERRYLHFLWDTIDHLPIAAIANFAIPFRRILAQKLFKRCGKNFISEENVRFNLPQNIEIGDDVFFNRGVFLDSKGGIEIGNSVGFGESVMVFSHTHDEANHALRTYQRVHIKDYSKVFSGTVIMPGVIVGEEAGIAPGSIVTKNIETGIIVGGIPAKPLRERRTAGRRGIELNHIWLHNMAFQRTIN